MKARSFFKRQAVQLQNGGVDALYRKVKKFGYLLFMNMFAPLAVYLKIDWLKAYNFVGKSYMKRLKKIWSQPSARKLVIKKIEDQTIQYLKMIVDREPSLADKHDWINTCRALGVLYYVHGKMEEM